MENQLYDYGMEKSMEVNYSDPFLLTVFGVAFIIIGTVMLSRHNKKKQKELEFSSNWFINFLIFKLDFWLFIILGIAFICAALGIFETLAAIVMILIIMKLTLLWFI